MHDFVELGQILKPHGLKGAMKIAPFLTRVLDYKDLSTIYIGDNNKKATVLEVKSLNGYYSILTDIIDTPEKVDAFRQQYMHIDKNDYPDIFDDALFSDDIVGFECIDTDGASVGFITAADEYGASTVLTITNNGVSHMIPMVDDVIWLSDDQKYMIIDNKRFLEVRV